MNITTLDIEELGKGKIRHWLDGKQWSEKQRKILARRRLEQRNLVTNKLYQNETYH